MWASAIPLLLVSRALRADARAKAMQAKMVRWYSIQEGFVHGALVRLGLEACAGRPMSKQKGVSGRKYHKDPFETCKRCKGLALYQFVTKRKHEVSVRRRQRALTALAK
jgi:hypothetical protein